MMQGESAGANHPLALRMAAISFFAHNLMIGCIFGSYGVLMAAVEARMHMSRDLSSLGISLVLAVIALTAPVFGVLVGKLSIRLLMMVGALLMSAGFMTLAVGDSPYIFLLVYALLFGPAMSLNSTMLPLTLVTRWYNVNRGRALGIVTMPLLAAAMAPVLALVLRRCGLMTTYFILAGLSATLLLAAWFVVDYPPNRGEPTGDLTPEATANPGMSVGQLLRTARFWTLSLAFAAVTTAGTVLAAHVVPLAMGWGIDAIRAASLVSFSSIGGMIGSVLLGWVADRLGGALTLGILCISGASLWILMLLQPPYIVTASLVGLIGFTGAPIVAIVSIAFSQSLGRANFGRALGMCYLLDLPCLVLGVPAAAHVYVRTGSYAGAIIGLAAFLLLGAACALMSRATQRKSKSAQLNAIFREN
jgi:predicted MFS family arabinose efflux permease